MKTIEVQFRKLKGEVFAVFPYIITSRHTVLSYAHIGQHSECTWVINSITKPVNESEYLDLLNELKSIYTDFKLVVIKRRNHDKYMEALRIFCSPYIKNK